MAQNKTYRTLTVTAAGSTTSFPIADAVDVYVIKADAGAVVLAGNVTITGSGTPVVGSTYSILIGGGFTLGGNTFTVFGQSITAAQCLYKQKVLCYYNGSSWDVYVDSDDSDNTDDINGADIVALSIPTAAIAAQAITLPKIANAAARGSILTSGVNGAWQVVPAVVAGQVLLSNGTDPVMTTISGAITLSSAGVATIPAGYVTNAMLATPGGQILEASLTIPTASVLTLNATPLTIVAAPGAGKYIEVISASTSITFVSAAYATNTTLQLISEGATIAQMQDTSALVSTVSKITIFQHPTGATAGQTQVLANTALQVKVGTGNPTTGDSNIIVKVAYRIVTV